MNATQASQQSRGPHCPQCGERFEIEPIQQGRVPPCPACGSQRWFVNALVSEVEGLDSEQIPTLLLQATEKTEALREIVAAALGHGQMAAELEPAAFEGVIEREALGSTGIGRGFAFPHTRLADGKSLILTIGFSTGGIDYQSLDGQPVHTLVLLLSPADAPADHLRVLEGVSRNLRSMV